MELQPAREPRRPPATLSTTESFLDSLVEHIPNMVFVKRAADLRFVRLNRAGEALLGLERGEFLGRNDYDIFPRDQADFFTSQDRAILEGGRVVDIPQERIRTRLLGERILHTKKIPLLNPAGEAEYLLGISEDITERVKAEALREQLMREEASLEARELAARRLAFLAEASTVLAATLRAEENLGGLARMATRNFCHWCTITLAQDDGTFRRTALAHRDPLLEPKLESYLRTFANRTDTITPVFVVGSGQPVFWPDITDELLLSQVKDPAQIATARALGVSSLMIVPIETRGKIFGAVAFVAGATDARYGKDDLALATELGRRAGVAIENATLYETAQRAVAARDEFLSVASHELKTPIASLQLQIQIAQRNLARDREELCLDKIKRTLGCSLEQTQRLAGLVEELLDVSSLQANRVSYHFAEHDLTQIVKRVTEYLRPQFNQAGRILELDAQGPLLTRCDAHRLERVVTNLVTNAWKYGGNKPILVRVASVNGEAAFSVRDQGQGIAPEKLDLIFRRFERAGDPTAASGLGLGLYIAKQIILAHHGRIEVESRLGEGSCFHVFLPQLGAGRPG